MTPAFLARRRAEEFDALVEGASAKGTHDARDVDLLDLVGALRGVPEPAARPEFVAGLRERLLAEAETALVPDDLSRLRLPERRTSRERRLAAVAGGIAIVGATTSIAVASQSALPGDSLYPVKRVLERAHTGISVGEGAKGQIMLTNASDRLDEVDALTHEDDLGGDQRIADTLSAFTEQATKGSDLLLSDFEHSGDESSIARLRDFASSSLDRLAAIEPRVPDDARDELVSAAGVLLQIDTEADQRCPSCGGTPIDSVPPVLLAAPITFPEAPAAQPVDRTGDRPDGKGKGSGKGPGKGDQPDLPAVDGDVGPGSVLDPPEAGPTGGAGDAGGDGGANPVRSLTEGLLGGLNPSGSPTLPVVGGLVEGVGGILEGVLDPLTGQTTKP